MNIWHTCVKINSFIEFDDIIVKNVNKFNIFVKKIDNVYQTNLIAWKTSIVIWNAHNRIVRDYIFNKFTKTSQNIVENTLNVMKMWLLLQKRFFNQKYIKMYNFIEQIQFITFNFCDDDIQKYIVKLQSFNKNLIAMNQNEFEFKLTFKFFMNLKNKFKKYVFRIIISTKLSSFDKINIDLIKFDRIIKHEISIMILRIDNKFENFNIDDNKNNKKN